MSSRSQAKQPLLGAASGSLRGSLRGGESYRTAGSNSQRVSFAGDLERGAPRRKPQVAKAAAVDPALARCYRVLGFISLVFQFDYYVVTSTAFYRVSEVQGEDPDSPSANTLVRYGWIAASFALAAIVGAPIFGLWSDKRGTKEALVVGTLCMAIGNVLYCLNWDNLWLLQVARIVSGMGSACRVACLGYISKSCEGATRGQKISTFYSWGMLGMVVGPAAGALFSQLPRLSPGNGQLFTFGPGNAPALASLALDLIAIVLVLRYFLPLSGIQKETLQTASSQRYLEPGRERSRRSSMRSVVASDVDGAELSEVDLSRLSVLPASNFALIFTQFVMVLSVSTFETLVVPLLAKRFKWGQAEGSLILMGVGVMVLVSAVIATIIRKKGASMRSVEGVGLILFLIGVCFSFDFNQIAAHCSLLDANDPCNMVPMPINSTAGEVFSIPVMMSFEFISCIFVSLGFTFAFVTTPGLFVHLAVESVGAEILPFIGGHMASLSIAASVAKIFGPLIIGYGLSFTANLMVLALAVLISLVVILWASCWKRLK